MGIINNKEKQAVSGNWGHPSKFEKKNTKIPNPLIKEDRHKGKKRKRKKTGPYRSPFNCCPFCDTELPFDPEKTDKSSPSISFFQERLGVCFMCSAKKIEAPDTCPGCKSTTFGVWKKNGVYKHQYHGCGFVGKKKVRRKK